MYNNNDYYILGKTETKADLLKSLFALYIHQYKIAFYTQQGVNFKNHLYVHENVNGQPQHDREDHNHVLKRIATCIRNGVIADFDVRSLVACMHNLLTGLTYIALIGRQKKMCTKQKSFCQLPLVTGYKITTTYLRQNLYWQWQIGIMPVMVQVSPKMKGKGTILLCLISSWKIGCLGTDKTVIYQLLT